MGRPSVAPSLASVQLRQGGVVLLLFLLYPEPIEHTLLTRILQVECTPLSANESRLVAAAPVACVAGVVYSRVLMRFVHIECCGSEPYYQ